MGKKDDLIAKYHAEMDGMNIKYNTELFEKVVTGCGPSIYNADASTVSGTDSAELDTVKNNFLIKKLGLTESDDLDGAIASTIDILGKSNRNKYRAIFYYLLTVHFKKESVYA